MSAQKYIVVVVFICLLIWGPIDHSWPAWLLIRTGYLIVIPVIIWFLLRWIWKYWQPIAESEDRLERALAGATSGVFFVLTIIKATASAYVGNTMTIQTLEGMEDVGDYILLPGPDWGGAIIFFLFAAFAFWYSIAKR